MKKVQKTFLSAVLVLCVLTFGAWTYQEDTSDRYADAATISVYANTNVYYTSKNDSEFNRTAGGAPQYETLSDLTNACGAVAGAEIVAFYDKYFSELVPNWTSYYPASGRYRAQDKTYVPAVMRELYTLMRTNVDDVGVSASDFTNGLKAYVNNHGYSVSYQNVVSGSSIDYGACKQAIDNNKVIALLARAGEMYQINNGSGYDSITTVNITDLHIMVAYGYQKIEYSNANGVFRTDTYLEVATGWASPSTAYYKINPHNLNAAYIVNLG